MSKTITLSPGYLVGLSMGVDGGVVTERVELGAEITPSGAEVVRYKTTRITPDPEEFKAATQVRLKARGLVRSACLQTPFGMVCTEADLPKLEDALTAGKALVDTFNAASKTCKVRMAHIRGKIAKDEAEAVQSVRVEVQALLADLNAAIQDGDVGGIRDLCQRCTSMERMLAQKTAGRDALSQAKDAARKVAREIVKRVQKQGETVAKVLEEANLAPIATARFAFSGDDFGATEETVTITEAPSRLAALDFGEA